MLQPKTNSFASMDFLSDSFYFDAGLGLCWLIRDLAHLALSEQKVCLGELFGEFWQRHRPKEIVHKLVIPSHFTLSCQHLGSVRNCFVFSRSVVFSAEASLETCKGNSTRGNPGFLF